MKQIFIKICYSESVRNFSERTCIFLDRDIAWVLYSVIFYYQEDDLWLKLVRETLEMHERDYVPFQQNYPRDINEQKYRTLRLWMQQNKLSKLVVFSF